MFKNLPQIKQGNVEAFIGSKDFEVVVEKLNSYIDQLRDENEYLARAIEGSAATAVELDCLEATPHLKEWLLGNCIAAILIVLQVVDRALGSAKLQKLLTDKID